MSDLKLYKGINNIDADLIEEADDQIGEETADHDRNRPEIEPDPVVNPVRDIEQEQVTVTEDQAARQQAAQRHIEERPSGNNQAQGG